MFDGERADENFRSAVACARDSWASTQDRGLESRYLLHRLPSKLMSFQHLPMNRHQLEVIELDRRHRIKMRALSFLGAGLVVVLALWSAGVPPTEWVTRVQGWIDRFGGAHAKVEQRSPASPLMPSSTAPAASASSLPGTDSSVSPVPLALTLVSTSPGRSAFEGTARIGTDPTNPQTYTAGALLANGARLVEIHKTHVILQRGEKRARLNLVDPEGPPTSVTDDLLAVGGMEPVPAIQPTHEILTDYIRPNPVFDGEVIRGYEVYAGQHAGAFSQLGLQAGDLIIALNDVPFTDTAQAIELFREITTGAAVIATIERKGKRERVSLDGALITADQERRKQPQVAADPGLMPPPG